MPPWEFATHEENFTRKRLLLIRRGDQIVTPLDLIDFPDHRVPAPTLGEQREDDAEGFLRAALNHAWSLGMRPDGFLDTTESMAAARRHLEDMRSLVFHQVGIAKP